MVSLVLLHAEVRAVRHVARSGHNGTTVTCEIRASVVSNCRVIFPSDGEEQQKAPRKTYLEARGPNSRVRDRRSTLVRPADNSVARSRPGKWKDRVPCARRPERGGLNWPGRVQVCRRGSRAAVFLRTTFASKPSRKSRMLSSK